METIDFPGFSAKNIQISLHLVTTYKAYDPSCLIVINYNFLKRVENISILRYNMTTHIGLEYISWRIIYGSNQAIIGFEESL